MKMNVQFTKCHGAIQGNLIPLIIVEVKERLQGISEDVFLHLRILMMTMKMVMHLKKKMPKKLMIKNKMMSHSLNFLMWLTFVMTYLLGRPSNVYEFALIVWTLISMEAIIGVMYLFVMNA